MRSAHRARSYESREQPGEADSSTKELAAWGEHALLDDLVCADEHRLRDREPECLRRLEVDDQLELGRLLDGKVGGLDL